MTLIQQMANDFSRASLEQIADAAEHRAKLLRPALPAKDQEAWDAAHDFTQLAAYCRKIIKLQEV